MLETSVDILARERIHLADSRAALERMRQHTASLEAFGGDHVSTEHLKQALYRRMKALEDDPTVPLFFGRLDYDASLGAEQDETLYIGRRHVTGEAGGEPHDVPVSHASLEPPRQGPLHDGGGWSSVPAQRWCAGHE